MANGYQNPNTYTNECLFSLTNALVFSKHVSRKYEDKFANSGGKIGDTFNIRRPARFTVSSGASLSTQDYTETSIPLVINNQKHIDTTFTTSDLTLKVDDFQNRIIKPKMIQLASQIDSDGLVTAKNTTPNLVGTPGTTPNSTTVIFNAGQKLDEMAAPRDGGRYLAVNPAGNAGLIGSMTGFFNDPRLISEQFRDAMFVDTTNTLGFKIGMTQQIPLHTTGPLGGTPLINGASQGLTAGWANTTSLVTDGWTAAAANRLKAGDVFTIANVFAVNPLTRQSTGSLQQFVVTADASSDGAGNLTAVVSPALISAGPFQNISAAPADNAAITVVGTANTAYPRNLAWHESAYTLGCVDLEDVSQFGAWGARKQRDGFSLRATRQYLISSDTVPTRVDILYGWASIYPELGCQMTG